MRSIQSYETHLAMCEEYVICLKIDFSAPTLSSLTALSSILDVYQLHAHVDEKHFESKRFFTKLSTDLLNALTLAKSADISQLLLSSLTSIIKASPIILETNSK